jgi:hypothetical protein
MSSRVGDGRMIVTTAGTRLQLTNGGTGLGGYGSGWADRSRSARDMQMGDGLEHDGCCRPDWGCRRRWRQDGDYVVAGQSVTLPVDEREPCVRGCTTSGEGVSFLVGSKCLVLTLVPASRSRRLTRSRGRGGSRDLRAWDDHRPVQRHVHACPDGGCVRCGDRFDRRVCVSVGPGGLSCPGRQNVEAACQGVDNHERGRPGHHDTFGLYPVATTGGASAAAPTVASLGTVVTSSTAAMAAPSAAAPATPVVSSAFTFPAAGFTLLGGRSGWWRVERFVYCHRTPPTRLGLKVPNVIYGQVSVTTTRARLTTVRYEQPLYVIKAASSNAGPVYIGDSAVTVANGHLLASW